MTKNIDRAAEIIGKALTDNADASIAGNYSDTTTVNEAILDGKYNLTTVARALANAGLLMPDIPNGLNLIGFERKGGGGGLLWDDQITTEILTKGYTAMFARLDKKETRHERHRPRR